MEEEIDLRGNSYFNSKTKYKFSLKEILKIKKDLLDGLSVEKISKKYSISVPRVNILMDRFIFKTYNSSKILGSKLEPYYNTEEELFNLGIYNYTWEDLTDHEKKFYLNYETKKHNNKINRALE